MAGLTRAPNANEPIHNPVNAKTRRDIVLKQMVDPENAFITQEEYQPPSPRIWMPPWLPPRSG